MDGWAATGVAESELAPGSMRAVSVGGLDIALALLEDGTWAAFGEWCTHEECPLSDGDLEGERVICYCHGSEFDVRTGAVLKPPAEEPLRVFEVRVAHGRVELRIDSPDPGT